MPASDVSFVFQWWSVLFFVGVAAFPLTKRLFGSWFDHGYGLSKAVGLAVVTYGIYLGGTLYILPFTNISIYIVLIALFVIGILISNHNLQFTIFNKSASRRIKFQILNSKRKVGKQIAVIVLEEVVFFGTLFVWSWVKGHEPSIQGLEKFMDYGFMQSILVSRYFPAPDMWYAGGMINYYYFGHIVTALLTKLSGLNLSVTFNLMLATLCAFTFTMSMGIGIEVQKRFHNPVKIIDRAVIMRFIFAGFLTGFLTTFAGNMQTIYAFTKGYVGENVVPFWTILWPTGEFFSKLGEGFNTYWYANATRFIPFTIHEFPSYSFVVSDVHGHVLSIPFVLLALALFITMFCHKVGEEKLRSGLANYIFFGFLGGILLMTNAIDGPIYFGLFAVLYFFQMVRVHHGSLISAFWHSLTPLFLAGVIFLLTALPFLTHFDSFAKGIGVNCPPSFLANSKIGPFLFEGVEKCQASPLWMMWLLWGFFWFCGVWLFVKSVWPKEEQDHEVIQVLKIIFLFCIGLIIFPEFFYVKDIYPAHFRSNTMFKLGYQAFMMWSIISAFVITHFLFLTNSPQIFNFQFSIFNKNFKFQISNFKRKIRMIFLLFLLPQILLVSIYPIFSVRSYFGELRTYKELNGLSWLEKKFPDDFSAIQWLKTQDTVGSFVILEADGDSYTDYNHMSAFSGAPSVVGWAVHEWLWRGGYDRVSPRREDVRAIYEGTDGRVVRSLLEKYGVTHIVVGKLEKEKFKKINIPLLDALSKTVFVSPDTTIYEVLPISR